MVRYAQGSAPLPAARPSHKAVALFVDPLRGFSSLRLAVSTPCHRYSCPRVTAKVSWRRGRDWLRYASGLCPDPADRLFAPEGSPNRGSHPFGWLYRPRVTVTRAHVSPRKYPGGGEGIGCATLRDYVPILRIACSPLRAHRTGVLIPSAGCIDPVSPLLVPTCHRERFPGGGEGIRTPGTLRFI